ncbi:MAG: ABC transporter ATP-binding protein [Prolixibacteraceae bacterium]|jgi:ABC-2 type transport system ATP-binding protein|nr:ABC transporter ATP-binding protein [Prolixibacteraceae bacterium]
MIEITNLNFKYGKQANLFDGLSLSEKAGNIVGLLGKNGAGKSTLLKLMTGMLTAPKASIEIMGETPFDRLPRFLKEVYFVPEEYELPASKIGEFVKAHAHFYPRFDSEKLYQILIDFELNTKNSLSKLSYGQRKKFMIAFALSTNCKLLIFDEPTNGLDIPSKAIFRKVVAASLGEDQLVVISTHQVKDVENLIDTLLILDCGQIKMHRTIWDIAEKYAFITVSQLSEGETLYSEVAPGGYKVIKEAQAASTTIDMELLFNAVVNGVNLK